ncbi:MAG: OmpA family protein [Polyangiales bacterium]
MAISDSWFLHPIVEWTLGVPVNRQRYECVAAATGAANDGRGGCLKSTKGAAFPMRATIGARVYPGVKGLSFFAAADIGITGTRDFVQELQPTMPYMVSFGLSYSYAPSGHARSQQPPNVESATKYEELDADKLEIVWPIDETRDANKPENANEETAKASVDESKTPTNTESPPTEKASVEKPTTGRVIVTVTDAGGTPIANSEIQLDEASASSGGTFENIVAGTHRLHVQAPSYYEHNSSITTVANGDTTIRTQLVKRSTRSLVVESKHRLVIRGQIMFVPGSAQILDRSMPILYELAELLRAEPKIELVEVQGHTDNSGNSDSNMELSQRRAEAVSDWLTSQGVSADRLTSRGYGDLQPIVPNITAENRARNRRVQFTIHRRAP